MKNANALELEFNKNELEIVVSKEKRVPPWRQRLKWWLSFLLSAPRLVREVGPNNRPLERYEFETLRARYERRVL